MINKLIKLSKSGLTYEDDAGEGPAGSNKKAFHATAKKVLKKIADTLGLLPGSYDIRSNLGGIAVSGEITLHAEKIYIQISADYQPPILYRSCSGRKDYMGGQNNWMSLETLRNDWDGAIISWKSLC